MKHREFSFRVCFAKRVYPRILPNVCSVATVPTQLNVVAVWCFTAFEDEHQFVLTAVERTLATGIFDPHAQVLELGKDSIGGGEQFGRVTPIHANEIQRPGIAIAQKKAKALVEESCEFRFTQLACCHGEFGMTGFARAGDKAVNRIVVWRVSENGSRTTISHQQRVNLFIQGIAASQAAQSSDQTLVCRKYTLGMPA